jgi:hypothetical protein
MLLSRTRRTIRPRPRRFARTSGLDLVGGEHDLQGQDVSLTDEAGSTRRDSRSGRTLSSNSSEVSLPRASVASLSLSRSATSRDYEQADGADYAASRVRGEWECVQVTVIPYRSTHVRPSLCAFFAILATSASSQSELSVKLSARREGSRSTLNAPS